MKYIQWKYLSMYMLVLVLGILTLQACQSYYFRTNYKEANRLLHETENLQTKPYLKAHMKNGDVCVLKDSWQVDSLQTLVYGQGIRYDFNRTQVYEGALALPIDSVAIFETNEKIIDPEKHRIAALSILAGLDFVLGVICISNPKACFGSCPTFYLNGDDNFHYSDAEGFSNAISPSLEYFDIDALNKQSIKDKAFSITMKNEALETHCVNAVKLLACPLKQGERVYQSPANAFYRCKNNYALQQAAGDDGDLTPMLKEEDRQEWFSLADEENLNSREEVYLTFESVDPLKNLGLIVNFRQSLMTTYFIYSAMGYMGDEVGDVFAALESEPSDESKLHGIKNSLGNIDVYVWNEKAGDWLLQGGFYETGPIAFNRQIIPISGADGNEVRIKLVLNKGLWRMDYVALTQIVEEVKPLEILPTTILNKGEVDSLALNRINTPDEHLISMPGSAYEFQFELPYADTAYDLYLYSKGYYLEWMRQHWIKDKDLLKLKEMLEDPEAYLQSEAKNYKRYETSMEEEFWNSRINTETFSYYDN